MTLRLDAYLQRIQYFGPRSVTPVTLVALHRHHLRAIPFENLDVQLGREVALDIEHAYEKIVLRNRGGWCYEMNGLFAWALREIGFEVTPIAGGVWREERGDEAFGNHLALLVHLDGLWLADVGLGDGLLEPVPLAASSIAQGPLRFGLKQLGANLWRFVNHPEGAAPSFDFWLSPADKSLLEQKCCWLQTAPESRFVLNAICQIHTAAGLMLLRGRSLKSVSEAGVTYRTIADANEYRLALHQIFKIDLPEVEQIWARILAREMQRSAAM